MARRATPRVRLDRPTADDRDELLRRIDESRAFHKPWLYAFRSPEGYQRLLDRLELPNYTCFFMRLKTINDIAGVFDLSEITRGALQSTYLGFYALAPYQGQGYMEEGLRLLLQQAFGPLRLHRVEANIQPANKRSSSLVQRCGFKMEGYSPRYLKIGGRWRDHERWAILSEDWRRK